MLIIDLNNMKCYRRVKCSTSDIKCVDLLVALIDYMFY